MRSRGARGTVAAVALAVLLPAPAAEAAGQRTLPPCSKRTAKRACIQIRTVPAVPGLTVIFEGKRYRTDARGRTKILAETVAVRGGQKRGLRYPEHLKVLPKRIGEGLLARRALLYDRGTVVTLEEFGRVAFRFVDLQGRPVDPRRVRKLLLKSRTGVRYTVRGGDEVTLPASRVVMLQGGLQSKPIEYSLESVDIDGSNVVNRAQLRFLPLKRRVVQATTLLYAARFKSRDALFGFPIGSHIVLTSEDGHVYRPKLVDGRAQVSRLARGRYTVSVAAPGMKSEQPLMLSRDQVVELKVLSYLDVAFVVLALSAIAIVLLVARRPHLRRPGELARARRRRASAGGRG